MAFGLHDWTHGEDRSWNLERYLQFYRCINFGGGLFKIDLVLVPGVPKTAFVYCSVSITHVTCSRSQRTGAFSSTAS